MRRIERRYFHASVQTPLDLLFIRILEQQIDGLLYHSLRLFDGASLACHAELRASRHEPIILAFDYRREFGKLHRGRLPHQRSFDQRGIAANSDADSVLRLPSCHAGVSAQASPVFYFLLSNFYF
jgi:hypothetical protein